MSTAVIRYVVRCLSIQCARGTSLSAQAHYFPTLSVYLCETEKKRERESLSLSLSVSVYSNFHEGQIVFAEIFEEKGPGGSWHTKLLDESKVCVCAHTRINGVITA